MDNEITSPYRGSGSRSDPSPKSGVLIPFGKHKGALVDDVPIQYLRWMVKNTQLYGDLERAVKGRLGIVMPVEESVDDKIDRIVRTTVERLIEAMEEGV